MLLDYSIYDLYLIIGSCYRKVLVLATVPFLCKECGLAETMRMYGWEIPKQIRSVFVSVFALFFCCH